MIEKTNEKVESLPFSWRKQVFTNQQIADNWRIIESRLKEVLPIRKVSFFPMRYAAAVFVGVLMAGVIYWWAAILDANYATNKWTTVSTGFGQKKRLVLPDSSVVMLNSNSSLSIPTYWNGDSSRLVKLKGEAFFEITKDPHGAPFIVHTEFLDVKVLGTQFNVYAYDSLPTVALKEGRVEVFYASNQTLKQLYKPSKIELVPGQLVTLKAKDTVVPQKVTTPTDQVADWTNNEYYFNYTTLGEIGSMIKNRFGYSLEFEYPILAERNISGHLKAASLEQLLEAMRVTLGVRIERQNDILLIKQ